MNRIITFEIIRARTLKSTWIFPIIGIAMAWALTYFGLDNGGLTWNSELQADAYLTLVQIINNSFSPLSIFFITVPFAQAFGHEYRDGTMRLTLSAYPTRGKVFLAKLIVPSIIAVLADVVAMVGIRALYNLKVANDVANEVGWLDTGLRHLGFTIMWGVVVAAVVIFTRNLAAGIAGVVVWAAILEPIVAVLLQSKVERIQEYLPFSQGMLWTTQGERSSLIPILVTTALFFILSGAKFLKRDA